MDPDDWVKNSGPGPFLEELKRSLQLLEFQYKNSKKNLNTSLDLGQFISTVLHEIGQIKDPIIRELQARSLSKITKVSENSIFHKLSEIKPRSKGKKLRERNKILGGSATYFSISAFDDFA